MIRSSADIYDVFAHVAPADLVVLLEAAQASQRAGLNGGTAAQVEAVKVLQAAATLAYHGIPAYDRQRLASPLGQRQSSRYLVTVPATRDGRTLARVAMSAYLDKLADLAPGVVLTLNQRPGPVSVELVEGVDLERYGETVHRLILLYLDNWRPAAAHLDDQTPGR